jgi:hypothetical protein
LRDIPRGKSVVKRFQNVFRVIVWGAILKKDKLLLLFIICSNTILFPARFCAISHYQTHSEVVKRQFMLHDLISSKRLACIVTGSQPFGNQHWLHKTHDFGQIQNPLDKDSGRYAKTIGALCVRVSHQKYKVLFHGGSTR